MGYAVFQPLQVERYRFKLSQCSHAGSDENLAIWRALIGSAERADEQIRAFMKMLARRTEFRLHWLTRVNRKTKIEL